MEDILYPPVKVLKQKKNLYFQSFPKGQGTDAILRVLNKVVEPFCGNITADTNCYLKRVQCCC